MLVQWPL